MWSEACYFKQPLSLGDFLPLAITSPFPWEKAEISSPVFIFSLATLQETHLNQPILGPYTEKNGLQLKNPQVSSMADLPQQA